MTFPSCILTFLLLVGEVYADPQTLYMLHLHAVNRGKFRDECM